MDLPTYTNIWRIEKRLYKLYDLRLPMPLPLVQIGVFIGVFLPWILLLQMVGVPFHAPWHVAYLVPPGVLTWLATRPVIEGKRLTELLISQVRYLTEARTWARLTPIRAPGEVVVVGRVWRRGPMRGGPVRATRPAERAAAAHRAGPHPLPIEHAGPGRAGARRAAGPVPQGTPVRPATAARAAAPGLRPTPHDGTAAMPPAAARGMPAEPTRPHRKRPEQTRPEQTRPEQTRPETVRRASARRGPAAPSTALGLPPMPGPAAGSDRAPAPVPPAAPVGGIADSDRSPGRGGSAGDRQDAAERSPAETRRRVTRPRGTSHEPESSVPGGPRRQAPAPSVRPSAGSPARYGQAAPYSDRPGAPAAPNTSSRPVTSPAAPGGPAAPGRPGTPTQPGGPIGRHAAPPQPPTRPGPRPADGDGRTARRPDGAAPAGPPAGSEPSRSDQDGRRTRAGGEHPTGQEARRTPGPAASGKSGPKAPPTDEERGVAQARTDQIVWPAKGRGGAETRPKTGRPAAPGPTGGHGRPAGTPRGRSHGEDTAQPRGRRPAGPASRDKGEESPAASWTPSVAPQAPASQPWPPATPWPASPPRAPAAGHVPPQPGPPRAPQTRPQESGKPQPARPVRPAGPIRPGGDPQSRGEQADPETAESPARAVRSDPASPARPGPIPRIGHDEGHADEGRGLRRIFSGGGHGDGDYERRVRTAFAGSRRVVVLGCTGGAGQTVTALMLGHTFAHQRGDRIVAVDVNPGPGAMARRTRTETRETLTSLITHAEQVTGYQVMRRHTSASKSGLEVIAAGKNPVQALDDRDYALAMRTLDRFYSIMLIDAAAAVVARVLPYADQIVLVAPASSDAPRAVAMTFEWLDGHGYEDLRARAVTVINGVSRRSMDDVEQAESVARGRCRALVRVPWDDHLSLDRAPRNELRSLRSPTRKAYIALAGVVAGGLVHVPERYPRREVTR